MTDNNFEKHQALIREAHSLEMQANNGDPEAQYKAAEVYYEGNIAVAKDEGRAVSLLIQSAKQDNAQAYSALESILAAKLEYLSRTVNDTIMPVFDDATKGDLSVLGRVSEFLCENPRLETHDEDLMFTLSVPNFMTAPHN